ncbi:MAG TPA: hypothetical protein VN442_15195 [Bryobacteraceae bacterium]|nr:hypothetical protein [Bryobacteraceae bacterium]
MKLGAEPKKVAILGGLVLVGAYLFYANVLSGPGAAPSPAPPPRETGTAAAAPARVNTALPQAAAPPPSAIRRAGSRTRSMDDFRPSMKRRPDDQTDTTTIDPMLRLDLLAKVQSVAVQGGSRNVFQFSAPPPPPAPKTPEPKIMPKIPGQVANGSVKEPGPAKPPPPPPINLKYYGYSTPRGGGQKTAFFLDGEDILVAGEGETVKRRYKVVRIGLNSVVMEDTESKSQQTLPLAEDAVVG